MSLPDMMSVSSTVAKTPQPTPWIPMSTVNAAIEVVNVISTNDAVLAAALTAMVMRTADALNVDPIRERAAKADAPNTERANPMALTADPRSAR